MASVDTAFSGSIPEIYDRLLVPLIFEAYARDAAQRIAALEPTTILETAAGTGVVARATLPLLKSDACYVASDLNLPMLDYAESRLADRRVGWRQADAQKLPFEDASFDAVCCQFGAMFFPDRVRAYAEARRVLKPGGRFILSVWDRIEDNVFAMDVTDALAQVFDSDPPRFLARTPHGHHDRDRIRDELNAAGFNDVRIDTKAEVARAEKPRDVAVAYCQGTPLRAEIEARGQSDLEAVTERVVATLTARHGEGPICGRMQALIVTAKS